MVIESSASSSNETSLIIIIFYQNAFSGSSCVNRLYSILFIDNPLFYGNFATRTQCEDQCAPFDFVYQAPKCYCCVMS